MYVCMFSSYIPVSKHVTNYSSVCTQPGELMLILERMWVKG